MKIGPICDLLKSVTQDKSSFLKLMKYSKQSPTIYEDEEEYNTIFENLNSTLLKHDFIFRSNTDSVFQRQNAFIPLCKHGLNNVIMTFINCKGFKRIYTNNGIGFTYNTAKVEDLLKGSSMQEDTVRKEFFVKY